MWFLFLLLFPYILVSCYIVRSHYNYDPEPFKQKVEDLCEKMDLRMNIVVATPTAADLFLNLFMGFNFLSYFYAMYYVFEFVDGGVDGGGFLGIGIGIAILFVYYVLLNIFPFGGKGYLR